MKVIQIVLLFVFFSLPAMAEDDDTIKSESTVRSDGTMETTVNSPPPSAITPQISASNSDLCTVGVAGAVQTQILGISAGRTVRDMNCEKLKNAKVMYDMGMKVAAVSVMCQDERVFDAMMNAGTPCPKDGLIGDKARLAWEMEAVEEQIEREQNNVIRNVFNDKSETKIGLGIIFSTLAFLLAL